MQTVSCDRVKRSVVFAALAAAVLSGCGGGGGSSPKAKAPTITAGPKSRAAALGGSTTFGVVASGTGTLSYQWFRGGVAIDGATEPSFTINPIVAADFATYTVRVTNAKGTVVSSGARLTVEGAPTITAQPNSVEAITGDAATFTVEATGDAPLAYQWSKDGVAIPGANGASYTIDPVAATSAGTYSVVVSNGKGSETSNAVLLTIVTEVAPSITTHPGSLTVAEGAAASFTVVATGTPAPTFQWFKNGAAIPGATSATYTIPTAVAADAGSYYAIASNSKGNTASNPATLTVAVAPAITTQPQSQSVDPGDLVVFSVAATGTAPLSYQWSKNGVAIPGATGASYTIAAATASNAGTYRVRVSNVVGAATSADATLTVSSPPAITQQPIILVNGGSTSVKVVAAGSGPLVYQWYRNGVAVPGATEATYTLGTVNSGNRGVYYVIVSNSAGSVSSDSVNVQ